MITEPHRMLVFDTNFRNGGISQATLKSKQGGAPVYNYLFTGSLLLMMVV